MSNRLYAATRKGLFTIERGNSGWRISRASFLGMHVPMMLADARDGALYAALEHGHFGTKLHRSSDGGNTFEEITAPAYPPPDGPPVINPMNNKPFPQKLEKIWALEPGHKSEPGVLWCGTIPGGLFRSNDSGKTWELNRPLWDNPGRKEWFGGGAEWPGIHSICVDPHDGKKVMVGVSCGGVWTTTDGGASWNCQAQGMFAAYMPPEQANNPNIQDVHRLAHCAGHPAALWAQHHNGVFRTTDGAASWHEVKDVPPSVFGFAVAVHPREPDTAWFVPGIKDEVRIPVAGQVVVTRTRNGGKSFDVLRKGLPQEHAYDLVYRHGLDIDDTGNRLAFGSTTGSLWITEDQGDSWQAISEHLPPVYAVRFDKETA